MEAASNRVSFYRMDRASVSVSPVAQSPQSSQTRQTRFVNIPFDALLKVSKFLSTEDNLLNFAPTSKTTKEVFRYEIQNIVEKLRSTLKSNPRLLNVFKLLPDQEITSDNSTKIFLNILKTCRAIQTSLSGQLNTQSTKVEEAEKQLVQVKKYPLPSNAEEIQLFFEKSLFSLFMSVGDQNFMLGPVKNMNFRFQTRTFFLVEKGNLFLEGLYEEIDGLVKLAETDPTPENQAQALQAISTIAESEKKALVLLKFALVCPTSENQDQALQAIFAVSEPVEKAMLLVIWAKLYSTAENNSKALKAIFDCKKKEGWSSKPVLLFLELLKTHKTEENREAARKAILDLECPVLALELLKIDPTSENSEVVQKVALTISNEFRKVVGEKHRENFIERCAGVLISQKNIPEALKTISGLNLISTASRIELLSNIINLVF